MNKDIFAGFLGSVDKGVFPDYLKHAEITPIHKKKDKSDKTNYRPVSMLPNISKIHEKTIYNQLYDYFDDILSSSQCGFCKGGNTQHCLLAMLEKFKESVDKGNEFGTLLTDLSKAFDSIYHKLLIAKLFWYGVSPSSLNLIFSYLSNRTQHVKIKTSYSDKSTIEYGVPQGSILGPLLFNIDLIDLFFECDDSEIASYADDATPYSCADDIPSVITQLQSKASKLFSWFTNNHMKVNPGKCHILLSTKNAIDVHLEGACITSSSCEKLLGITVDYDLKFDKYISDLRDKVSKKINALCRVKSYMSLEKRRIVVKAFVESQFNYCPLIWMLHSRTLNNKINRRHERALRIVYSDYKSSFNTLQEKDGCFSIHHRNIQSLAIGIYKFLHGLSPAIMGDIIKLNRPSTYNLRTRQELYSRNPKTVRYGTETISFLAPKIWAVVPQNIKNCTSFSPFKINIRKWKPDCPCRLCKCFLKYVGFI